MQTLFHRTLLFLSILIAALAFSGCKQEKVEPDFSINDVNLKTFGRDYMDNIDVDDSTRVLQTLVGATVRFRNTSTPPDKKLKAAWNFIDDGEGNELESEDREVTYAWPVAGLYKVRMCVGEGRDLACVEKYVYVAELPASTETGQMPETTADPEIVSAPDEAMPTEKTAPKPAPSSPKISETAPKNRVSEDEANTTKARRTEREAASAENAREAAAAKTAREAEAARIAKEAAAAKAAREVAKQEFQQQENDWNKAKTESDLTAFIEKWGAKSRHTIEAKNRIADLKKKEDARLAAARQVKTDPAPAPVLLPSTEKKEEQPAATTATMTATNTTALSPGDRAIACVKKSDGGSISLTPSVAMELSEVELYADLAGKVDIALLDAGSNRQLGKITARVVQDRRSQISLSELNTELQPGKKYTLSITPRRDATGNAPRLDDVRNCDAAYNADGKLKIDFQGNKILFNLKYRY